MYYIVLNGIYHIFSIFVYYFFNFLTFEITSREFYKADKNNVSEKSRLFAGILPFFLSRLIKMEPDENIAPVLRLPRRHLFLYTKRPPGKPDGPLAPESDMSFIFRPLQTKLPW